MGRNARLKRERREARKKAGVVKHHKRDKFPPCSYKDCEHGRPEATHLLLLEDGNYFAACDDCIEPMMQALRMKGINAQVVTKAAVEQLSRAAKRGPLPEEEHVVARCSGTGYLSVVGDDNDATCVTGGAIECPGCDDCTVPEVVDPESDTARYADYDQMDEYPTIQNPLDSVEGADAQSEPK